MSHRDGSWRSAGFNQPFSPEAEADGIGTCRSERRRAGVPDQTSISDESLLPTGHAISTLIRGRAGEAARYATFCQRGSSSARDHDAHTPNSLGDHARRLGVQAGVVSHGSDRCRTGPDGDEDGVGRPAARVPTGRRGQPQDRPGTCRAVPLLIAATEHDPQPLTDMQVNGPAVVRPGHRDFPIQRGGAWRRR